MSNLYLLKQITDPGYEEMAGIVVCASTSVQARRLADENCGVEGTLWRDTERASIKRIGTAASTVGHGVVLRDLISA